MPDHYFPCRPTDPDYITGSEACKIIGCSHKHLNMIVEAEHVGTWQIPGSRRRYRRTDCERVAAAAYRQSASAMA